MSCYYLGEYYSEGEYVCQGKDKYVCFENRWLLSLKDAPECRVEEIGWRVLKTVDVTLAPSEVMVGGWRVLKTVDITLTPSEEMIGGWKVLKTIDVVLTPPGVPVCKTDADCPTGYKCVGGKCVKKPVPPPSEVPWGWIGAGAAAAGGVLLLAKPTKKK